jgi:hypothetical protein
MAVSPFFPMIEFTVEPDALTVSQSKGRRVASRDVLLSDEAQWNLKLSDIFRNGVLCPRRYVATLSAIKLGNNIILATRTLHEFYSVSLFNISLRVSLNTSFGNRYSSPAEPKSTRISCRPKFSMSLTNVPCRGKRTPVFCDRTSFVVLSESPVFIVLY